MTLRDFVTDHAQTPGGGAFQLEGRKTLEVKVDGMVWAKAGSMIAYRGELAFRRSAGGAARWLKKAFTGEGATTMRVEGRGLLYLADQGKELHVLELGAGEALSVNGRDVLAFEESVSWDITMMRRVAGMLGGGLFNMRLEGPGLIAFGTQGRPLVLQTPVVTDPQATVAWNAALSPELKTDLSLGALIGRTAGETFQMDFREPHGFVVVQPYESGGAGPAA